ncbi:MAG: DUF4294 domain-containing protein [Bacteroidales bacterium]|nr:DUF4294 domain-containing protein [Bacteroidales bacterium]
MKVFFVFVLLFFTLNGAFAQQTAIVRNFGRGADTLVVFAKIVNNDTIPMVHLPEIPIYAMRLFDSRRDIRRIEKLIYNVKKVYPYARLAGLKLREYNTLLLDATSDKERKKIMKKAEDEINEQFGPELRDLTFTQGKILIKLIDRETTATSYTLLKDLRGGFTAFFYQGFARIWGYNLKTKYDPSGEDDLIETIVLMIENGQI